MGKISIAFTPEELDFVVKVLGALPTYQTVQANMLGLIPNIVAQANQPPPDTVEG